MRGKSGDVATEIPDEVLRQRVALRDSVLELVQLPQWKVFREHLAEVVRGHKESLVRMDVGEFSGPKGIELKGRVQGVQDALAQVAQLIHAGNEAENLMRTVEQQEQQREQREKPAAIRPAALH